jgi:hypothetical protein
MSDCPLSEPIAASRLQSRAPMAVRQARRRRRKARSDLLTHGRRREMLIFLLFCGISGEGAIANGKSKASGDRCCGSRFTDRCVRRSSRHTDFGASGASRKRPSALRCEVPRAGSRIARRLFPRERRGAAPGGRSPQSRRLPRAPGRPAAGELSSKPHPGCSRWMSRVADAHATRCLLPATGSGTCRRLSRAADASAAHELLQETPPASVRHPRAGSTASNAW